MSTRLTDFSLENSSTNCSILGGIMASRIVTLLMRMAALIRWYFSFWLFRTRNHGFRYGPWHGSRIPQSSHSHNIFMSSPSRARGTWKPGTCHAWWGMVQIFWEGTTSGRRRPIWLKCQDKAFSRLNRTAIKISRSEDVKWDPIFKLVALMGVSLDPRGMSENFVMIIWSYGSRSGPRCNLKARCSLMIFCFQSVIRTGQSPLGSDWFTGWTLSALRLYAALTWCQNTSYSGSHRFESRAWPPEM